MKWFPFDQTKGANQPLPRERKAVLVAYPENAFKSGSAPATAVGYLRFSAGDLNSPYFVVPGIGGLPWFWCDMLPDDFGEAEIHPFWKFPKL